jgi:hypothetical protein
VHHPAGNMNFIWGLGNGRRVSPPCECTADAATQAEAAGASRSYAQPDDAGQRATSDTASTVLDHQTVLETALLNFSISL